MTTPPPPDLQPTLCDASLLVRPLVATDLEALAAAASDPLIWEQHPDPLRWQRPVFERNVFAGALASGSAFTVIERATGAVIGSSRYYDWQPASREISIGYTFLVRRHWGGATNAALKRLMLDHAFGFARTVWFDVGAGNLRSRRAMEKIGGQLSHLGLKDMGAGPQPYAFYRIDAPEPHA